MEQQRNSNGLSPELIEKVARLELRARMIADGLLSGMHRSPERGFNIEFLEHREYYPGDDPRHIDWKVFAKTGRYFVKQHEEERNLNVHIVLDTSASMTAGGESGKWDHGFVISAALSYLFLKQGDAVGLVSAGPGESLDPGTSRNHLYRLLATLAKRRPEGRAGIAGTLTGIGDKLGRRSFVIVVSDLLEEPEPIRESLRAIRGRGAEIVIFHVLSSDEKSFPFTKAARFVDPESGKDLTIDPTAVRAAYMKNLSGFLEGYNAFCSGAGIDFVDAEVSRSPEEILLEYLEKRERRKRR